VSNPAPAAPPAPPTTSVRAPGVNGNGKRLFVTVNGKRHQVTVETLD
jgi:hypothetical protein